MSVIERIESCGIVPVAVIENAEQAVPTARAMLNGDIDVMEITFRTKAAPYAIQAVSEACPEMLVGAGTIVTLDQCIQAVTCGAKFIVSPGFDRKVVEWCIDREIPVVPGCVTPSEITAAMEMGLNILKFFPANIYGGLAGMKSLSAPFGKIKFIPTGGIDTKNVGEYIAVDFVFAVGGSWICPKSDIEAGNFEKITKLCSEAKKSALGFELAHVGINCSDADTCHEVSDFMNQAFGFPIKEGNSSNFASTGIEVMKEKYLGENGHIAIRTNALISAVHYLKARGFEVDWETEKRSGEKRIAVYLKGEFGGFAIHLLQK